jgi:hypothetical protein
VEEPEFTWRERRILRGMMDDYLQRRAVDAWFRSGWGTAMKVIGGVSALAVMVAAFLTIARAIIGG